ncbi:MAG: chromate transporter [Bryobacterales bacterium]|nr:chromate transporter [Bryobacterales bacterium]
MDKMRMPPPTLASLTNVFLKAGNTTFGGGDPTMMALKRELGERRGWLSDEQFALVFSLARITPGTNVLAFCAGAAYLMYGWAASAAAVIAASAPSAVLAVWLTVVFESADRNPIAKMTVSGVLAAVVGMMGAAVWQLTRPSFQGKGWLRIVVLTGGTLLLREVWNWAPLEIMVLAAGIGAVWREI